MAQAGVYAVLWQGSRVAWGLCIPAVAAGAAWGVSGAVRCTAVSVRACWRSFVGVWGRAPPGPPGRDPADGCCCARPALARGAPCPPPLSPSPSPHRSPSPSLPPSPPLPCALLLSGSLPSSPLLSFPLPPLPSPPSRAAGGAELDAAIVQRRNELRGRRAGPWHTLCGHRGRQPLRRRARRNGALCEGPLRQWQRLLRVAAGRLGLDCLLRTTTCRRGLESRWLRHPALVADRH